MSLDQALAEYAHFQKLHRTTLNAMNDAKSNHDESIEEMRHAENNVLISMMEADVHNAQFEDLTFTQKMKDVKVWSKEDALALIIEGGVDVMKHFIAPTLKGLEKARLMHLVTIEQQPALTVKSAFNK